MRIKLFCLLFILLGGCDREEFPQPLPIILTGKISTVEHFKTQFTADVKTLGTGHNVIAYGFVWAVRYGGEPNKLKLNPMPTIHDKIITKSGSVGIGPYTAISGGFNSSEAYTVRAYLQTNELIIYGDPVEYKFVSN